MTNHLIAENLSHLDKRYPHIRFHLLGARKKKRVEESVVVPLNREVEAIYIYGLGRGENYFSLKEWLSRSQKHRLIFLEDEIEAFYPFLAQKEIKELILHPQVLIKYFTDPHLVVQECVRESITPFFTLVYFPSKANRFSQLQERLYRKMGAFHALNAEALFSPAIVHNVRENLLRLPEAGIVNTLFKAFHQIPAVICGAGPSLALAKEELKKVHNRALIIGGGSTIAGLNHLGIEPDIGFAFDPNPEEYERMKSNQAFMTPLFYGNRVLPEIFLLSSGILGYIKSETGGLFEAYIEDRVGIKEKTIGTDLGSEAFSVTTMAIATAVHMGCNPIILCGVDLAFTEGALYCDGVVPHNTTATLSQTANMFEHPLYLNEHHSNVKWMMESKTISNYALKHPEVEFINATERGIGFASIPYQSLKEVVDTRLIHSYDFQGMIYSFLLQSQREITTEKIEQLYAELESSLCTIRDYIEKQLALLQENPDLTEKNGMMILYEIEIESEIAYPILLQKTQKAFQNYIEERFFDLSFVQKQTELYQQCHRILGLLIGREFVSQGA